MGVPVVGGAFPLALKYHVDRGLVVLGGQVGAAPAAALRSWVEQALAT